MVVRTWKNEVDESMDESITKTGCNRRRSYIARLESKKIVHSKRKNGVGVRTFMSLFIIIIDGATYDGINLGMRMILHRTAHLHGRVTHAHAEPTTNPENRSA